MRKKLTKKQKKIDVKTNIEPDFRTNPSGWLGWNMRVYGNSFDVAKTILFQKMWLNKL